MEIRANAKINLFLDVHGLRTDGYHEICSVITPITLADRLMIEPTAGELELIAPERAHIKGMAWPMPLGPASENLVYKAAELLREVSGCRLGARIVLEKSIPVAAGLGGGSADAAATLVALNKLWQTHLAWPDLMELAGRLGCDVPALAHGGVVCARGRGEVVQPVDWRAGWHPWLLLANPGFGVSTGDIYGRYRQDLTSHPEKDRFNKFLAAMKSGDDSGLAGGLFNALQRTVFDKYPLLEMIAGCLKDAGASPVLLSGSGATLFVLARDAVHARAMADELRRAVDCPLWISTAQIAGDAGKNTDTMIDDRRAVCVPGDCPMV